MMTYGRMWQELEKASDIIFDTKMNGTITGEIGAKISLALKAIQEAQDAIRKEAGE